MINTAAHQGRAITELVEWWEDLHDCSTGSQLVSLIVPSGWGRSTVLDVLADRIARDESRPGKILRLAGLEAPHGLPMQVAWLTGVLEEQGCLQVRRVLGLHRTEGVTEAGLDLLGLFGLVTGLPALLAGLPASLLLNVAASTRDRVESGQLAKVARLAHGLASFSRNLPLAILIDDAELLDPRLVERLLFTLLDHIHSDVLAIVAITPDSAAVARFTPPERYGPRWDRIAGVDADPSMDISARRRLIEALRADWPPDAIDRLAARSRSYADVWAVLDLPGAADVPLAGSNDEQLRLVDSLSRHVIEPGPPPPAARALAWAGGQMHHAQLTAAVVALPGGHGPGPEPLSGPWISRFGHVVRFSHPAYRDRAERSASVLSQGERAVMGPAVVAAAREVCNQAARGDTGIEVVSALRPVLHLAQHASLNINAEVANLLGRLPDELESLGDAVGALGTATAVFEMLNYDDESITAIGDRLTAIVLRLGRILADDGSFDRAAGLAAAMEGGAILEIEARIWTAITLLDRPPTRPDGARLADAVLVELDAKHTEYGDAGVEWRLLLAFHAGRGGYLTLAEKLLAPLLGDMRTQDLAFIVLAAASSEGGAELRLRRQALLAAYEQLDLDSDLYDRLGIVDALASVAHSLGDYAEALIFGSEKLAIRLALYPVDHPDTLASRGENAAWTGELGDARRALALSENLLLDETRVFGSDHPRTLTTRNNTAFWVGEAGDARGALALFDSLLLDQLRVLGPDHPTTLTTRSNLASLTGQLGDSRQALALCEELLPDLIRVLGPLHPETLTTRDNVAFWTLEVGDLHRALALSEALIPDMVRVFGPAHPRTLTARSNAALWTGETGDHQYSLALLVALLPDILRVLGPDHPNTLTARDNVATMTARVGDAAQALVISQELLPDMVRVFGPNHPDTLKTRANVAIWTGHVGHVSLAIDLYEALLPDMVRVFGLEHPTTVLTRAAIESLRHS